MALSKTKFCNIAILDLLVRGVLLFLGEEAVVEAAGTTETIFCEEVEGEDDSGMTGTTVEEDLEGLGENNDDSERGVKEEEVEDPGLIISQFVIFPSFPNAHKPKNKKINKTEEISTNTTYYQILSLVFHQ
jgi:hypothetical protein